MRLALYFLSIFSLSQAALLVRWAGAPPDVVGFWRMLAAALILLPFAWRHGDLRALWTFRRERLPMIALTAAFFFTHLWTYVHAAQNTRIAHCMILFATNPLWVALGNRVFFGGRFTLRLAFAYLLAATGILLLVHHSLTFETDLVVGDLVALLSAVLFAGYLLAGKKARLSTGNAGFSFLLYAMTGIFFGLNGTLLGVNFVDWGSNTWLAIAGTVILPTLLGHMLFTWLIKFMDLNLMSCGKLIEPILAAGVAAVLLSEPITGEAQAAFACTAAAVLILFAPWPRRRSSAV